MGWNLFRKATPQAKSEIAKAVVTAPIAVAPPPPVATATIVKESAIPLEYLKEDAEREHKYALGRITGFDADNPVAYFYPSLRKKLADAGFTWIVGADFIKRFPYAAGIGPGVVAERIPFHSIPGFSTSSLMYVGDMPDSVIARYEEAKKLLYNFSVHSAQPLAVARYTVVDPVLVGWHDYPMIRVDKNGKFIACSDYCMGVVVALWDGDKEISVL